MQTQWISKGHLLLDITDGDAWVANFDDYDFARRSKPVVRTTQPHFTLYCFAYADDDVHQGFTRVSISLDQALTLCKLIHDERDAQAVRVKLATAALEQPNQEP